MRLRKCFDKKEWNPLKLERFTEELNNLSWKVSLHATEKCMERVNGNLSRFLKSVVLSPSQVFEYYTKGRTSEIRKACYRLSLSSKKDIILVVAEEKLLVTIYFNDKMDTHRR